MSGSRTLSRFAALVDGIEMTSDLLTGVVTAALMQADVVADELYETIIPELPPAQRAFPSATASKIANRDIFDDSFARDIKTLIEQLGGQVGKRTHVFFHGDENHVRGGYESVFREPGVQPLAAALGELDLFYDLISASLSAADAARVAATLMDE
ncbi:hypothetical protein A3753_08545 [Sulfitobacter sp. HI0082]|uniref:hypothetical protein n=1 Tax=uncultured Sulfitobacter sp. TaxID=191468 RepID=UPI0007D028A2|nr:hypothetical protein A3753_08545 [Sulfitobacter sp. HI0082]HAC49787.1 hypothetical protein [Sulfitobacter sp.]|tara:strand:- start:1980 stop:2444 length:465 start_codon:yes stop_codon:yes gene_type:complete